MHRCIPCSSRKNRGNPEFLGAFGMRRENDSWVDKIWYGHSRKVWLLVPFSQLYELILACRNYLYRAGVFRSHSVAVPVIIIGNITVGGTGKTPLTIWLAKSLREKGMVPGIVSRGYRGKVGATPVVAVPDSDPTVVGDEAILLAAESECVVVVHPDRVAAAQKAMEVGADIII